jgi:predicted Fe-S protein YdhL (DUF1289 family)
MHVATTADAPYIMQPVRETRPLPRCEALRPATLMLSPCIRICAIEPATGLCVGCGRSLDEIARWSRMSDEERRRIMNELAERRSAAGRSAGR